LWRGCGKGVLVGRGMWIVVWVGERRGKGGEGEGVVVVVVIWRRRGREGEGLWILWVC
jgi:hypothetical protein